MERNYHARIGVVCALLAIILTFYSLRLYSIQVVNQKENAESSNTFTYTTRVTAARGEILDRNGKVLVTNRASYNLVLINAVLFSDDNPNDQLRRLVQVCKANGYDIIEHLPITEQKPYEYTLDQLDDTWVSHFRDFLEYCEWDPDISAGQLVKLLRERYHLPTDWSEEELRMVTAIRYELDLRYCTYEPTYILLSDVSSDVLTAVMELGIPGLNVESSTVREYKTTYAAHILGSTGQMNSEEYEYYKDLDYPMDAYIGKDGLEAAFEEQLHGTDGYKKTTMDADGSLLSEEYTTEPIAGNNVELSIDIALQAAGEDALARVIQDLRENGVGNNSEGKDAEGGADEHRGQDGEAVQAVREVDRIARADDHDVREGHESDDAEREGNVRHVRDEEADVLRDVEGEAHVVPAREGVREALARFDGKRQGEVEGRDHADQGLPGELLARPHAFRIMIDDLAVVVDPADGTVAERHEEHDPDEPVREIRPEKGAGGDAGKDEGAAHRGGAVLRQVRLRTVRAHGLTEMQGLEFPDHPGTEGKADHEGRQSGQECARDGRGEERLGRVGKEVAKEFKEHGCRFSVQWEFCCRPRGAVVQRSGAERPERRDDVRD